MQLWLPSAELAEVIGHTVLESKDSVTGIATVHHRRAGVDSCSGRYWSAR